jgi:hypothetical protein
LVRDAARLRERVHFVLVSGDKVYGPDALLGSALILPNPHLVGDEELGAGLRAWATSGRA